MAKAKTEYVCQQCGRRAAKALGRCPQCGAWNSMLAEIVTPKRGRGPRATIETAQPMRLMEIEGEDGDRIHLPIKEFARVLGGGVVPGSVVLIGGSWYR